MEDKKQIFYMKATAKISQNDAEMVSFDGQEGSDTDRSYEMNPSYHPRRRAIKDEMTL